MSRKRNAEQDSSDSAELSQPVEEPQVAPQVESVKAEIPQEVIAEVASKAELTKVEEPQEEIAKVVPELKSAELSQLSEESQVAPQVESAKAENPLQPVSLELLYGDKANTPPEKLTKEKVEASVRQKLAKKTDEEKSDPFVPQAQLDNEVIQVAKEKGFHLSRGTEVGARLIARSRRKT